MRTGIRKVLHGIIRLYLILGFLLGGLFGLFGLIVQEPPLYVRLSESMDFFPLILATAWVVQMLGTEETLIDIILVSFASWCLIVVFYLTLSFWLRVGVVRRTGVWFGVVLIVLVVCILLQGWMAGGISEIVFPVLNAGLMLACLFSLYTLRKSHAVASEGAGSEDAGVSEAPAASETATVSKTVAVSKTAKERRGDGGSEEAS